MRNIGETITGDYCCPHCHHNVPALRWLGITRMGLLKVWACNECFGLAMQQVIGPKAKA